MKLYDETMEALRFSEDFCEKTLEKLEQAPRPRRARVPRALVAAALTLLVCSLLFCTAWAASAEFRALFVPNDRVKAVEQVTLPEQAGTFTVNDVGPITARYYKLDGEYANHDGADGFIPVEKDGKTTIYRLDAAGELVEAEPSRRVRHSVDYRGEHWDVDLLIYEAEPPIALGLTPDGFVTALYDANTLTLYAQTDGWGHPLYLDLTTGALEDPLAGADLDLSALVPADERAQGVQHVQVERGGRIALLSRTVTGVEDGAFYDYRADLATGEVTKLGEQHFSGPGAFSSKIRLCHGNIYSNENSGLAVLEPDGSWRSLLEQGERCHYDGGRWALAENRRQGLLTLLDLDAGTRMVLSGTDGAIDFMSTTLSNPAQTLLAVNKLSVSPDSLNVRTFAVVDPENLRMVTLEREPGMPERSCGWLDNSRFLIAGSDSICVYTIQ